MIIICNASELTEYVIFIQKKIQILVETLQIHHDYARHNRSLEIYVFGGNPLARNLFHIFSVKMDILEGKANAVLKLYA